jgi:hypothetical protein
MWARRFSRIAMAAVVALSPAVPLSGSARAACAGRCTDGLPPNTPFTVTAKLWIPFKQVVDPFMADPESYADSTGIINEHLDPNCAKNTDGRLTHTTVESAYHGDGHHPFSGSFRVTVSVSFSFNGTINSFKVTAKESAPTIRLKTYRDKDGKVVASCSDSATAKVSGGAENPTSDTFKMNAAGSNPLAPFAPNISISVKGTVSVTSDNDTEVALNITSGNFPSAGVQVTGDGKKLLTVISNDASCIGSANMRGWPGARTLFFGLESSHSVNAHAFLSQKNVKESHPSGACG